MNTINRVAAVLLPAVTALTYSAGAWSLGLGDAEVESFLNQPLRARIELIHGEDDDLSTVSARLASADDYELIGASLDAIPVPIRFSLQDPDGDAYILATSKLAISDPIVRLIVEVNWARGRLLREYTLFLDPPTVQDSAPPPRVDLRAAPPAVEVARAETARPAPAPAAPRVAAPSTPPGESYGPVKSGDTLWDIATDWSRGSGLNVNKVMIAIQRENPQAFARGNINLLKRGAILRMPSLEAVEDISARDASAEVASQQQALQARRSAESVASPATPLLAEESRSPVPAPVESDLAADAEPADVPAETESQTEAADALAAREQLELVPPSEDEELQPAYGTGLEEEAVDEELAGSADLREDLARTEEELINQQQQNAYLEEQIQELEARLAAAEEAAVQDAAEMASMEERLREQRQSTAERARQEDSSWFSGIGGWLIALLAVLAAAAGWWFSRRGGTAEEEDLEEQERLRGITAEAEQVLQTLQEPEHAEDAAAAPATSAVEATDDEEGAGVPEPEERRRAVVEEVEDAELLDQDSADPEIQLDLARAYISMGDKEAARVILEEVVNNGTEQQQADAQSMLDLLSRS
jgi:pilus assembly protein FimV